jgi:hypothetical protein
MSWQKASYVSENSHEMLCDMTHTDTQTVGYSSTCGGGL